MTTHQELEFYIEKIINHEHRAIVFILPIKQIEFLILKKKKNSYTSRKRIKQVCLNSYLSRTNTASKAGVKETGHRVLVTLLTEDNGKSFQSFKGKLYV